MFGAIWRSLEWTMQPALRTYHTHVTSNVNVCSKSHNFHAYTNETNQFTKIIEEYRLQNNKPKTKKSAYLEKESDKCS